MSSPMATNRAANPYRGGSSMCLSRSNNLSEFFGTKKVTGRVDISHNWPQDVLVALIF